MLAHLNGRNLQTMVVLGWTTLTPFLGMAAVSPTVKPDVFYVEGTTRKICQLVGDTDYQWLTPTENLTETRAGFYGTDLGVPFTHNGLTYVVFGDTLGRISGLPSTRTARCSTPSPSPVSRKVLSTYPWTG
jgi:hypothetical protein